MKWEKTHCGMTSGCNNDQIPVTCNCAAVTGGGQFLGFHAVAEISMKLHYWYEYVEKKYLNVLYFVYN